VKTYAHDVLVSFVAIVVFCTLMAATLAWGRLRAMLRHEPGVAAKIAPHDPK